MDHDVTLIPHTVPFVLLRVVIVVLSGALPQDPFPNIEPYPNYLPRKLRELRSDRDFLRDQLGRFNRGRRKVSQEAREREELLARRHAVSDNVFTPFLQTNVRYLFSTK